MKIFILISSTCTIWPLNTKGPNEILDTPSTIKPNFISLFIADCIFFLKQKCFNKYTKYAGAKYK